MSVAEQLGRRGVICGLNEDPKVLWPDRQTVAERGITSARVMQADEWVRLAQLRSG